MDAKYQQVFENNRKWIEEHKAENPNFFEHLALGQTPDFLFIGCADSRVPANNIMGLDPGEVFVHRNIANLVVNTDMNAQSVIQYAVEQLEVKHVVVCGHYGCGGVKAAMGHTGLGLIDNWLREIRDTYTVHVDELDAITHEGERYDRLVELNVLEQCRNVLKTSYVQKRYTAYGSPWVHGWVFDVASGSLVDLKFDFDGELKKLRAVYDLTK